MVAVIHSWDDFLVGISGSGGKGKMTSSAVSGGALVSGTALRVGETSGVVGCRLGSRYCNSRSRSRVSQLEALQRILHS